MKKNNNFKIQRSCIVGIISFILFILPVTKLWAQDQIINFSQKSMALLSAFNEIEQQTNLVIAYNEATIDVNQIVSTDINGKSLSFVLSRILKEVDVTYKIQGKQIIIVQNASKQSETEYTGKVIEKNGEPMVGAIILIKGTNKGTATDLDGKFSINAQSGDTLVAKFLGYQAREIKLGSKLNLSIVLSEDLLLLNDVVVIGYGSLPKRSVSTAVSTIKADIIDQMPVTNVGESLYGQLPGLYMVQSSGQPGDSPSMRIRGTGSLTASSNPLYVIDGFPTNDADYFANLSAKDIESISVLKDAASAAIYGSRAGNGVILVTTKKGQKGTPKVNFNTQFGSSQPQRYIDVLDAYEFASMVKDARINQGMAPLAILDDPSQWTITDWQKDVYFRTADFQRYNVSVSGAAEKIRYSFSAQYQDQEGIVQNSFFNRLGFKSSVEADISKYVTAGVSFVPTYSKQRRQTTSGGNTTVTAGTIAEAVAYPPIYGPYVENGDYFQIQQHTTGTNFNSELCNPLSKLLEINDDYTTLKTMSQAFIKITPIKNLVVKSDFNLSTSNLKNEYYRSAYSPGSSRKGNISTPNLAAIDAYRLASFDYNWYWSTTANYTFNISKDQSLTAMAGYDAAYFSSYSVRQDDRTDGNYPIAYGNTSIKNVNGAYIWNGTSSNSEYAFDAVFARLNYDYMSKYLLSASIRQDRSSKFGPDNRAGLFWSASAAWNLTEEEWMKSLKWLNIAKIRSSYGVTGNDNIGNNYVWTSSLSTINYVYGSGSNASAVTGYYPSGYSNRGLGWETNTQFDLGVDFGFFDRVSLTIDWYNRVSDAVLSASIPNLNGKSNTVTMNAGQIRNRGLEIATSTQIINNKTFKWTSSFNIAFNRNKLLSLATGNDYYGSTSGMIRNYVGRPLGDMYLYVNIGTFNSAEEVANDAKLYSQGLGDLKFQDTFVDGTINSKDMVFKGNNMPKFNAGWTNQFKYKDFDISAVLDGQYGGLVYWGFGYASGLNRHMENAFGKYARNRWRSTTEIGDGISQKAGSSNVYGALVNQTRYLFKSDYLKIRNIALGYTLPNSISSKLGLSELRLSVNAQNLFSFDEYPGYSVEAAGMGGATGGSDGGNYPTVRTLTFGVNVNF
jgi:TonB-linked SusC/RagA family outer membrane protein